MDEREWLTSTDPQPMLEFLRTTGRLTDRKARLFAVACCNRIWPLLTDERSRRAVEVAERYADGLAGEEEMAKAGKTAPEHADGAGRVSYAHWAAIAVTNNTEPRCHLHGPHRDAWKVGRAFAAAVTTADHACTSANVESERAAQAAMLRDIFGTPPFRSVPFDPALRTPEVLKLAQVAYDDRPLPSGALPADRLAVLADALEAAGCTDADILGSCGRRVRTSGGAG